MDFDKGDVSIEVIIEDNSKGDSFNFHDQDHELDQLVYQGPCIFGNYLFILNSSFLFFPQTADHVIRELSQNKARPVLQKLADTKLIKKLVKILSEKDDAGDPILEDQIKTEEGSFFFFFFFFKAGGNVAVQKLQKYKHQFRPDSQEVQS